MEDGKVEIPSYLSEAFNPSSDFDISDNFKIFLGRMKERIYDFVYKNESEIKSIYSKLKNNEYKNLTVKTVDTNLIIHKYEEYLDDMIKFIEELSVKPTSPNLKELELCEAMINKDKDYFESIAEISEFSISDAMQNVETLINLQSFIHKTIDIMNTKLNKLEYDNSELKDGLLCLFASSVSTFIEKLIESIFKTFNEISVLSETGARMALESTITKPRPYVLF